MISHLRLFVIILMLLLSLASFVSEVNDAVAVDVVPTVQETLWQEKSFKGNTTYEFIEDKQGFIIKASCDGNASALYKRMDVDLTKTPILRWSWKVGGIHSGLDDISKSGDDYVARVYVVYKGLMPWNIKALNYVWANKQGKGSSWGNAYTSRAKMIAQESGDADNIGIWVSESRNVYDDFKQYFGSEITNISGVAVMTDCDNGGGKATGYYRDIRFTAVD